MLYLDLFTLLREEDAMCPISTGPLQYTTATLRLLGNNLPCVFLVNLRPSRSPDFHERSPEKHFSNV
jgi:hypothetical protein